MKKSKIQWHEFKTDPPYNYKSTTIFEEDPDCCWFYYRYKNRPHIPEEKNCFLSFKACLFIDGVFLDYKSHMETSPYPEDHIEILYWCLEKEVINLIKQDFDRKFKGVLK